jgi:hypothetical protein
MLNTKARAGDGAAHIDVAPAPQNDAAPWGSLIPVLDTHRFSFCTFRRFRNI